MQVFVTEEGEDWDEASVWAAGQIIDLVRRKPAAKLGFATGGSVEGVYGHLVAAYKRGEIDFSQVSSVNLDEYLGLVGDCPQSYRYYMQKHLFDHINIPADNAYVPNGAVSGDEAIEAECKVFEKRIHGESGDEYVDLQLLGVGANGHIAFNEPQEMLLRTRTHVEQLHPITKAANARYFPDSMQVPEWAITQGIGDILKAKRLIVLICGQNKARPASELLAHDRITTHYPVTMLKLHPKLTVILEREVAKAAKLV